MSMHDTFKIAEVEKIQEYDKWNAELPFLKLKNSWTIKVRPPCTGAIVRFNIKCKDKEVSVYFDAYDRLGYCRSPYFEVYPLCGKHDVFRFLLKEHEKMLLMIDNYFKEKLKQDQ